MSIEILLARQNADGGWSYNKGNSWTEPTVYAVLALLAARESKASARAVAWIRSTQKPDGGWAPQASMEQSTWVTAMVALLPPDVLGQGTHDRAVRWLLEVTGEESTWVMRLRRFLQGVKQPADQQDPGWPWVPGAAAWVSPTTIAILALEKAAAHHADAARIKERVARGRKFLISRMCKGGGWNHGSARALGYEVPAYPESTGMALTAFRGVRNQPVEESIALAKRYLAECRSAEALNWLRLGLMAHGQLNASDCPHLPELRRTNQELALHQVVESAQAGRNPLWS